MSNSEIKKLLKEHNGRKFNKRQLKKLKRQERKLQKLQVCTVAKP